MAPKKKITESLMEQLKLLGAEKEHYTDMIKDYISLWDVKTALTQDIKTRGVTYMDVSSVGVMMQKNNPSVKELVMVNRQMLSILRELGLTTANIIGGDEDEL